jgi:hypothetical protein
MDPIIETTSPILTPNLRNKPTEARDAIAVDRIVLRNDLRLYIREAWQVVEPSTVYLENWHIDLIAEYLEAVTAGQIKRLLIDMPQNRPPYRLCGRRGSGRARRFAANPIIPYWRAQVRGGSSHPTPAECFPTIEWRTIC